KETQIRTFVETHAPQYRPLLKHKRDSLELIPPNLTDDRLDVELYKIDQQYGLELREKGRRVLAEEMAEVADLEEHERCFKRLSMVDPVEVGSADRADIIVFNRPFALASSGPPSGTIVLVEFKRPGRDDYTDRENPIAQIYDYVRQIRAGTTKDHAGRPLTL